MIEERRKRYEKELHEKYLQLYHNEQCYEELMQMLEEAYQNRPAELRRLDDRREKEPNWYRNRTMLGMTMYPKLFAGGLKGVIEHLDYLSEQKITYLHLMPLLKMPHPYNDGGYAVEDFKQVDPEIGTNEELKRLTKELRKRGISLCLDVVMNHTADTHEWAIRAKRGEQEYMDRYQCYETREILDQFEKTMPQVFPETAPGNFTWCEEMHRHVLTTFYPYQWDLNYHNPKVFNEMIGNILYLANMGVEVFRIDAVPYIWKELGTNCRNLPQVHLIVRMLRMILEMICPAVILKGEVVMEPKELPVYFGTESEPECHMLYGVSSMVNLWAALATRDTRMLKHQMDVIHSLPKNCYFVNYLRCHDDIGWGLDYDFLKNFSIDEVSHKKFLNDFFTGKYPDTFGRGELYNDDPRLGDARLCGTTASLCGIEKYGFEGNVVGVDRSVRYDITLHAFMLSQSGIPVIYSGDEIGQVNDYSYKDDPDKAVDSRYLHRGEFNWSLAPNRNIADTVQGKLFHALDHLEHIRSSHSVFDTTADLRTIDTWDSSILAIVRENAEEKFIGIYNFSDQDKVAWINEDDGIYTDLISGHEMEAKGVMIPAFGCFWLCKKK